VLVAAIGLAAIGVAIVPQVAQIATANHAEAQPLPPFSQLAQRSVVYDRAGNVIDIFKAENREPFKLSQVPKDVINDVLAVEDETFYQHKGVNAKSLVRAILVNVSAGEVTQGGSTITQQLVKNSLLTSERDANRKILEAAYALRLEKQMSKDEILERYLNTVYLGNNAYGFQAAAETYFGKKRRPARHLGGCVPRWPHPEPVRLRPDRPSRAGPGPVPPGARPPRRRRHAPALAGRRRGGAVAVAHEAALDSADAGRHVVLLRRGPRPVAEPDDDPRRRPGGPVQQAVPRRF